MTDLSAKRTLVKSPPELWTELSEVDSLARHLGEFGEIRITRTEPESRVAWEGEQASGTVELQESGWGTKVTLRATIEAGVGPAPAPPLEAEPEPSEPAAAEPGTGSIEGEQSEATLDSPAVVLDGPPAEPRGFFARWRRRRSREQRPQERPAGPEPILAASIADGTLTVVERGSAEPDAQTAVERGSAEPEAQTAARPEPEAAATAEPRAAASAEAATGASSGEPAPDAEPAPLDIERALDVLETTLDSLGAAHHRPFSRG